MSLRAFPKPGILYSFSRISANLGVIFFCSQFFSKLATSLQTDANCVAAVEAAGGRMADICRVDVYVIGMEHFDVIHKVRREYFKAPLPASTMVEISRFVSPDYLIEMNAIAVIP
jgi:hypothetical protein